MGRPYLDSLRAKGDFGGKVRQVSYMGIDVGTLSDMSFSCHGLEAGVAKLCSCVRHGQGG